MCLVWGQVINWENYSIHSLIYGGGEGSAEEGLVLNREGLLEEGSGMQMGYLYTIEPGLPPPVLFL